MLALSLQRLPTHVTASRDIMMLRTAAGDKSSIVERRAVFGGIDWRRLDCYGAPRLAIFEMWVRTALRGQTGGWSHLSEPAAVREI